MCSTVRSISGLQYRCNGNYICSVTGIFVQGKMTVGQVAVYKAYVSQVQKLGYGRYVMVHVWLDKGTRLGTPADAQVSQHDSTVYVQKFFPPKWRSIWWWHYLMMSLISFLCKSKVGIRGSMQETWGSYIHSFHLVLLAHSLPQTL